MGGREGTHAPQRRAHQRLEVLAILRAAVEELQQPELATPCRTRDLVVARELAVCRKVR